MVTTPGAICDEVLAVVVAALAAAGRPVASSAVIAGSVAWDDCCAGYAYAGVARRYRSLRFPAEDIQYRPCDAGPWAAEVIVGVQRCVSTLDDAGRAPDAATITAESQALYDDGDTVWAALSEWLCETGLLAMLAGQVYQGAEGGCVEVTTRLFVGLE